MKYLFGFFVMFCFAFANAQTGEKNFIDQNYIEVTGKAQLSIVPDLIYIKIVLSEKDTKNRVPVTVLESQMISKFQELGIDVKKDLKLNDLLSFFRGKVFTKSDVIVTKEYLLTVHDAATASKVFLELEKIDISNVSIDHVDHTQVAEFRKEVKINAIKAAREKALALAKAIDQNIGRAIFIQEVDNVDIERISANTSSIYGSSLAHIKFEDVDFRKMVLEYSILVRFELK
ncbi:MAG: SIMPL domain-containing protein [Bacteroidetes bacterium]|nr:SIMPL domain-containing protein [Bacteroidota bacterium]